MKNIILVAFLFLSCIAVANVCIASTEKTRKIGIGMRVDCLHNFNKDPGETQNCLSLNTLHLTLHEELPPELQATLVLDPFTTLSTRYDGSPLHDAKPYLNQTRLGAVGGYRVAWSPRQKLTLALELFAGATYFPNLSGLSLLGRYAHSGWKQSAFSVQYDLPMLNGVMVKFTGGNGEGEVTDNHSPQQYLGFSLLANAYPGLLLNAGVSLNGNSVDSAAEKWQLERFTELCGKDFSFPGQLGYSTRRMGVALETDGNLNFARGLKVGVGWHKTVSVDLDKDKRSSPSSDQLARCQRLDPDILFFEDARAEKKATLIEKTVIGISGSYRILDTYFLGIDYQKRKIASNIDFFVECGDFTGTACTTPSVPKEILEQWSLSLGAGMDLSRDLRISLSYYLESYKKKYRQFYFVGKSKGASQSRDLFNARLSYHL